MKNNIVFSPEQGGYVLTETYVEKAFFQDCLDEFRENMFWEDLVSRLSEKELRNYIGEPAFELLSDKKLESMTASLEKALWNECARHGVERLGFIVPLEEN